jgi:formate hydrogenlyase subunit 3/multisubunit Na+/H+ antiporter MnhD subunit
MPLTSACFFIGAVAISGLPPLSGFMSKLTVFLALARSGMWWAAVVAVLVGLLTTVVLMRAASAVFWAQPAGTGTVTQPVREVPATMWVPMVVLAIACVVLGVLPQIAYPLLDRAAVVLATLGR